MACYNMPGTPEQNEVAEKKSYTYRYDHKYDKQKLTCQNDSEVKL